MDPVSTVAPDTVAIVALSTNTVPIFAGNATDTSAAFTADAVFAVFAGYATDTGATFAVDAVTARVVAPDAVGMLAISLTAHAIFTVFAGNATDTSAAFTADAVFAVFAGYASDTGAAFAVDAIFTVFAGNAADAGAALTMNAVAIGVVTTYGISVLAVGFAVHAGSVRPVAHAPNARRSLATHAITLMTYP